MFAPPSSRVRPASAGVVCLYLALLYYGSGVGLLESLLNYPLWHDMGGRMANDDFVATRNGVLWRVFPLLVIPEACRLPVTVALLALRPPFVPRWVPAAALTLQAIAWTSSALIQIPIQLALSEHGYSDDLFRRLMVTDLWLRVLPGVAEAAVGGLLLVRVARQLCRPAESASV